MIETGGLNIKAPAFGKRHLQCFLMFWGLSIAYAMRVNLSLAIVAMTDKTTTNEDFPQYDWSESVKSYLLSSFFWGYMTTQIFGGYIARRFGGKVSVFVGLLTSSILTVLTPLCASIGGWKLVFAIRVIEGMTQGVLFPTTHTLLAKWAPVEERAVMGAYCYTGTHFGTVVMLAASGFIASSSLGWPSIYYISGGCGIVWVFAWYIWGASSPEDCNSISIGEKNLIEKSLSKNSERMSNLQIRNLKTPWLDLVRSLPFISLTMAHCAFSWGFWTILTEIPSFMKNILHFDIKSNALLTALPYAVMLILSFVFTGIAGWMQKRKCLSLVQSRKLFNSISAWIPAIALIGLGYIDPEHANVAVVMLVIAVGLSSAVHVGYQVNHIDLSPNFAGILLGFTSTFSSFMSILAPITVGFIVTDATNPVQWRIVFFIAAAFSFIGNLAFVVFGSADVQPWNEPKESRITEVDPELTSAKRNSRVY